MNWIKIKDREPKQGQLVLVKGERQTELEDESEYGIGLCIYEKRGDHFEFIVKDQCYYSISYYNITEWCEVE